MAGFRQRGDEQITIAGRAAHQNLQKNNTLWKVPQALCFLHLSNATTSWRFSLAACVSFAPHTVFSSVPPVRTVSQVEMHYSILLPNAKTENLFVFNKCCAILPCMNEQVMIVFQINLITLSLALHYNCTCCCSRTLQKYNRILVK